ncbi:MAG TPA: SIMPL domain-containing protein [Pyrinomonadaceae bacterium]|nr:SIMPL domain-containing protein [Pyrinomonadaceae bacterium]
MRITRKFLTAATFAAVLVLTLAAQQASAAEVTVRGRLGRTVEAGGWLIVAQQKYLLLNAGRWADESWFREGAEVEGVGETKSDVVSVYMEGTPFEARTLRVAAQQGNEATRPPASVGTTRVVVSGDALVQERPDTAVVSVAVITQGRTALAAQQENATRTDAVVRAVKAAAGAGAEVETSGYSLQPQYTYREGQPPLIQSFQAQNSVTVTTGDLTRVGPVIDAATAAGANNVSGLSFILRRDQLARQRALTEATRAAVSKAQTLASALGGRVVRIVEVQEATAFVRPVQVYDQIETYAAKGRVAQQAPTPVEIGSLDIRSQVTLIAEVATGQ